MLEDGSSAKRVAAFWGGGALLVAATGIGVSTQLVAEAEPENRGTATAVTTDGLTAGGGSATGGTRDSGTTSAVQELDVSGTVSGELTLDAAATLSVTVRNTSDEAVLLRSVRASITRVTSAGLAGLPVCDPTWFTVESSTATRTLAAGRSTVVPLELRLRGTGANQDNCKSAQFDYSISAAADQLP